jgi:hypothetical protein
MPHAAITRLLIVCILSLPFAASADDARVPTPGLTTTPAITLPARPITTRAQLDAYLHDTPPTQSPLNWMTPGGRRRFLASIVFGERGVGGFSLDDLCYDLTREQIYTLLRLFGEQDFAVNIDARRTPLAAGELEATGTLEPRYDRLFDAAEQNGGDAQAIVKSYADDFAPLQNDAQRRALGNRDMELLFRATSQVASRAPQAGYLADLRRDFAELERRHVADRPHASDLYDALILAHQTDEARAFLAAHPILERQPPPAMRTASRIRKGQPSLWIASANRRELVRFRFNIHTPSQVLVLGSSGCHFSVNAARALEADPLLRDIFRENAQWVAPAADLTAFDALREWNRTYPDMRLGISYDDAELPMVKRFDTPTFFFLDHGAVVDTVVGWPDAGNLDAIRRGLREIDLLR